MPGQTWPSTWIPPQNTHPLTESQSIPGLIYSTGCSTRTAGTSSSSDTARKFMKQKFFGTNLSRLPTKKAACCVMVVNVRNKDNLLAVGRRAKSAGLLMAHTWRLSTNKASFCGVMTISRSSCDSGIRTSETSSSLQMKSTWSHLPATRFTSMMFEPVRCSDRSRQKVCKVGPNFNGATTTNTLPAYVKTKFPSTKHPPWVWLLKSPSRFPVSRR
mmetsp:Transcript_16719/g.32551  ORF Transcript_16719/g.32551 Transcript_16719/m.32551 type:complete len:215 (-) Transcript_16719:1212-1856(-)